MAGSELSELVGGKSERLDVEYKAWMDTKDQINRANLARHIAALTNHGGGYLVFGVDDATLEPMGETTLDRRQFGQDEIAGIAKRYLEPCPTISVEQAELADTLYPVVVVPSHGARPVVAKSDGPADPTTKKPTGIQQGLIYIRAPGPSSQQIKTSEEWSVLLDRCLAHRGDILGRIMRQAMGQAGRPSKEAAELLVAAVEATSDDFVGQTQELIDHVEETEKCRVEQAGRGFCALGYALLGDDGEPIMINDLRGLVDRASVGMHRYAYNGWSAFFPLTVPERAPQIGYSPLLGHEQTYLEGMRLPNMGMLVGSFDYWRVFEAGMAITAHSYREDDIRSRNPRPGRPYLTVLQTLWRIHSLLAHARLAGQEIVGVQQVLVRMDWRGLKGRILTWDHDGHLTSDGPTSLDRFVKTVAVSWGELRDSYFDTLQKVSLPLFDVFPTSGSSAPREWMTRKLVTDQFARMENAGARLFDD